MSQHSRFLFVCCQAGSENTCKQELVERYPGFRFAFSRPGFLTFKVVDPKIKEKTFRLWSTFARTWGWSTGKARHEDLAKLTDEAATKIRELCRRNPLTSLHVWQRDTSQPGRGGFEPGISPVAQEAADGLMANLAETFPDARCNEISQSGERTMCVIIVSPEEWWFGWHNADSLAQTWPGGAPLIQLPADAVNRAWLKIHEAALWGQLSIRSGDTVAEIGSAPGGASQYLLSLGANVVAIDPAVMDAAVASHPRLTHVRRKARQVPKRNLEGVRWLTIDINMPPSYTLEVIRDYVVNRGLALKEIVATLKLPDWKLASEIPDYRNQIKELGFASVETRQLAFNRQEVCLVAIRKRRTGRRVAIGNRKSGKE